ncbi:MAG: DUF721 domain-containing protein [Deltaproteobacteria bacterium]|nr:DUF721 domain-containing protein [Deltaproteobacteria bacterium]
MKQTQGTDRSASFSSLAEVLKKQLDHITNEQFSSSVSLQKQWVKIVGPTIAGHSHVLYLKKNTLFVAVNNSTWLNELGFMKESIIDKINNTQTQYTIDDVVFKIRTQTS